jgi:hypothetical protein
VPMPRYEALLARLSVSLAVAQHFRAGTARLCLSRSGFYFQVI